MARVYGVAAASLTAQNTFTGHIHPADKPEKDKMNLSISGLADSTVTLQRTFDGGSTWKDVVQYTVADVVNGDVEKIIDVANEGVEAYRVGIQTGDYGSDTVVCRLSH